VARPGAARSKLSVVCGLNGFGATARLILRVGSSPPPPGTSETHDVRAYITMLSQRVLPEAAVVFTLNSSRTRKLGLRLAAVTAEKSHV